MMTEQEMRVALAEWDGWNTIKEILGSVSIYINQNGNIAAALPNYPSDLNAVHELEKKLDKQQAMDYARLLHPATSEPHLLKDWKLLHSTALQRCEALCRSLFSERFK